MNTSCLRLCNQPADACCHQADICRHHAEAHHYQAFARCQGAGAYHHQADTHHHHTEARHYQVKLTVTKQMSATTTQKPATLASPTCKPSANQEPMSQPANCHPLPSHASRSVPIHSFGKQMNWETRKDNFFTAKLGRNCWPSWEPTGWGMEWQALQQ
ncbi:hypothetical protein DSO57_1032358 [Entomophthora muscae]|uniref:Uncharacterized protein n=1 Tax=Entomophthora muscae TaxID=34485 RepID=A0ACC2UA13_9FUNG|nr:hypothetical protein DSO57_1032358 [Entomophthora muscae]